MTFDELKTLRDRRAVLEAERSLLLSRIEQAESRLVLEYGQDWRSKYDEAVSRLAEWGAAHG